MDDSIVVAGMACRYPDAATPGRLWDSVLTRRRSFRPIPPERLPLEDYHRPDRDAVDHTYATRAAVLTDWTFDRARFRVPGEVYRAVDLTHWLALEVAADALTDAGFPHGAGLPNERVGVVLGNSMTGEFSRANGLRLRWPYVERALAEVLAGTRLSGVDRAALLTAAEARFKEPFPVPGEETLAGALSNTIAGRICNHFDFRGTGYTVDGACASSLVAVASAARLLTDGDLDVVLAGGVDLSLDPLELVGFARVGALAEEDMRIYDARPTGFLPGEGCGIVVLCRERFAVEHGLRPYARLSGWGTSSDGAGGLTRPEVAGQLLALHRAYRRAGISPAEIALVEGHGTGTAVGDQTELAALSRLHAEAGRSAAAVLGSVKANIGHTKAAAGVAGLIKAVLAVHHQVIPPTTGCESPHPLVADPHAPLRVTTEPLPWPGGQRYASVSAMGFGGINVHVVVGGTGPTIRRTVTEQERQAAAEPLSHEVVVCAAADASTLVERLTTLADLADTLSRADLTDLAATLAVSEDGQAAVRFAAAVDGPAELATAARRAAADLAVGRTRLFDPADGVFVDVGPPARLGYLFSGQAAPVRFDAGVLGRLLPAPPVGYDVDLASNAPATGAVADTSVAQPAILRASLAGLAWLRTLGVRAHAAIGHSLGEITALSWAGALSEQDAVALVRCRGAAMSGCPSAGGMASIGAPVERVRALLDAGGAVVSGENSATQTTVSGPAVDVDRVLSVALAAGLPATRLAVSHAFHSPLMRDAVHPLRRQLSALAWAGLRRPVCSTVTGDWLPDDFDPVDLLTRQLTEPVRFRTALHALLERVDLLVEVGPGAVLTGLAADTPGCRVVAMDAGAQSARGPAAVTAALFASGAAPDVRAWFARRTTRTLSPQRPPQFLGNPCELPRSTEPPRRRSQPPAPAPSTAAVPTPIATPEADHDLLDTVLARVAAALELEPAALTGSTRLVADLHLSSLRVSQIAAETATALGRVAPVAPPALATATLAEFAAMLDGLPEAGDAADEPVAGVASWVRAFTDRLVDAPAPAVRPGARRRWAIVGDLAAHPLAAPLEESFPAAGTAPPDGRLLVLPPGPDVPAAAVVDALTSTAEDGLPLVVVHHGGVGAAVARSLAVERPDQDVLVVETPVDAACVKAAAEEAVDWTGFTEVVYGADGTRTRRLATPVALPARHDESIPLAAGDVLLVSGGAKGIGLECAVALAEATGAVAVLLGRSPADDPAVRAALDRMTALGRAAHYHRVDVADRDAVHRTVRAVVAEHGPVRGFLHAAGHNEPRRIEEITTAGLRATLAPKSSFDDVLAALDLADLRFAVGFGSVIGRTGLPGQAEYAIANEWLARRSAELAVAHPGVHWLTVQWSAWSGVGMGVRLGALDALVRAGTDPISVPAGTDMLLRLLAHPTATGPAVLVAGRLPANPTLQMRAGVRPSWRFTERWLADTPAVENVVESTLSVGTDPYLDDHVIDGIAVLPAVFGLEAMAQTAAALRPAPDVPVRFTGVRLDRPITVGDRSDIRIAALAHEDGRVELALRADETGFAVDHFHATLAADPTPAAASLVDLPVGEPVVPAASFYRRLYFHGPRFQRVRGYHVVSAYGCVASVTADAEPSWFGAFHDPRLRLGDPGARDAVLHLLQACVPDRRVLPVAVEEITVWHRPVGRLTVTARQRAEDGDRFVYDVEVADRDGRRTERWTGLVLRAVGPIEWPAWPVALLGPQLARRLRDRHPGVDLAVSPGRRDDHGSSLRAAHWLGGGHLDGAAPGGPRHAPDGRIVIGGDRGACASHLDGDVLTVVAPGPVAVDWEPVGERMPPLDERHRALADRIAAELNEEPATAATRVWTGVEVLRKLGLGPAAPLVFAGSAPGGEVHLSSGGYPLTSVIVEVADRTPARLAVCLGTPA